MSAASSSSGPGPPAARLGLASAVLMLLALVEVVLRNGADPDIEPTLLWAVLGTAPVVIARWAATPAALAIAGTTLAILAQQRVYPAAVGVAVALTAYLVGRRRTLAEAALVATPYLVLAIVQPWQHDLLARLGAVGVLAAALGGLMAGRIRRVGAERAAHRATEQALADSRLDNAAQSERARIARELHDVVAHHISMISVQAETARLTVPGLPADGARQLSAIGETARTALTEMRRLLGVLRTDAPSTEDRTPQPGLAQLGRLVEEARAGADAPIRFVVRGPAGPLDPGIELTAYRVVQEALTNARRHAPGAAVEVELEYGPDTVRVRVHDAGPGPTPGVREGHGLLGMRERVAMAGGSLYAGAAPDGGYLVSAILPITRGTP